MALGNIFRACDESVGISNLQLPHSCRHPSKMGLSWGIYNVSVTRVAEHHMEMRHPGLQLMQLVIVLSLSQVPHPGMLPTVFTPTELVTNAPSSKSSLVVRVHESGTSCPAARHRLHRQEAFRLGCHFSVQEFGLARDRLLMMQWKATFSWIVFILTLQTLSELTFGI